MASNNEYPLPVTIDDQNKRQSIQHLPRFFRTDQNEKFLSGVFDPLLQPGKLTRVNGYIGRKDIPNFSFDDNYQTDVSSIRQYYQLEPGYVYEDPATGEVSWFADYIDYIHSLAYYGANTSNHAKLNTEEAYSWDPNIDWDKFVNFREYYWLPSGPDPITIYGTQLTTSSTFTVTAVNEGDRYDYLFTPDGLSINPRLTLYRGNTYTFNIKAKGKPFSIKTQAVSGNSSYYDIGVSARDVDVGTITFTVPYEAPDLLYYVDGNDLNTQGFIDIRDIDADTFLDVDAEIVGKVNYTSTTGIGFVNGLKIKFVGNVSPSKYATDFWYVEGVGTAIRLVAYSDLESTPLNNTPTDLPFDLQPFDSVPFENANNYPNTKEYITISRGSRDRNAWSRNNRWFHINVLEITATFNKQIASPDQTARAQRPIIEFFPDIKLYNYGWNAKKDVDLVDTTTTSVFSTVEGSLGYHVDGEPLLPGHRVMFTADEDSTVNGRIYKVSTINVDTTSIKFLSAIVSNTTAPFQVTFFFDKLVAAPPTNYAYYVDGNSNSNFTGLYNSISSTTTSVTLLYPKNPGIFGSGITTGIYGTGGKIPQLTLIPTEDSDPIEGEVVYAKDGLNYKGTSFFYNGTAWQSAQKKTTNNQAPLFDLYDENKISFSDATVYTNSSFIGNRIFGYRIGSGAADTELGIPLYYRSIDNVGDIEFEFDLENRSWTYVNNSALSTVYSYRGFIRKFNIDGSFSFSNGWTTVSRPLYQKAARILQITNATDKVAIDIFNNSAAIGDINAQVYVNNIKRNDISRENINGVAYIKFATALVPGDKVVYKIQTVAEKNARGYYEIPYNWQNNPFNDTLLYITLGEAIDHVKTIVENNPKFSGTFPGNSNLANQGMISQYGHRFLQHSGSFPLAAYLITDRKNNIVDALQWTANQYTQFKKEFLRIAGVSAFEGTVSERVDQILLEFSKSKYLDRSAFYFSDMAPYKGYTKREYVVEDPRLPVFVIDSIYNPSSETRRSVLVYVNDVQLTYAKDYRFSTTDAFVDILYPLAVKDVVTIKDYHTTNGCYIPYTPSKLGIYPNYQPSIYVDDTYLEPVKVIQGHDGSITVAYNDFRDDLILELEKRIYNTVRIPYDNTIFNLNDVIGGYYRNNFTRSFFSTSEINNIILPDFLKWNSVINQDYSSNNYFKDEVSFTYNYNNSFAPDGVTKLSGWWRSIYKFMYDTDRPHSHPWEMQGFTIKPDWWETTYGPAPYTSENTVLWNAIEQGIINVPGRRRTDTRYARNGLFKHLPVDDQGNLLSPLDSNLVNDFVLLNAKNVYVFGDGAPVETAWRKSSEYPFSIIKAMCILAGSEFIGKMWDRFTIKRNIAGQIFNEKTGKRFNTADIVYPNTPMGNVNDPNVDRSMSSGLSNIIDDYVFSLNAISLDTYKNVITGLQSKLNHRIGGYSSKDKLNVLLDSRSPTASGTVFLPQDNYKIFYNQSSPITSVVYSGVLIEKINFQSGKNTISGDYLNATSTTGYRITGYDKKYSIFQIQTAIPTKGDSTINVGGVTESYGDWTPGQFYTSGYVVKYGNQYYKAVVAHTGSTNFASDTKKWSTLSKLPITGGVTVIKRTKFSDTVQVIPYGTILPNVQSAVDFLLGYQERLTSIGFKFDDFNKDLGVTLDWLTSAKEFMFWSLQNWDSGAVITLSPAAMGLKFTPTIVASIDDFSSSAFEYNILKADGSPFKPNLIDIHRIDNGFTAKINDSVTDGIYFVRANLIQREHVLLLDNTSDFNDIVYDEVSGYRQGRVKLIGFKTNNWDGGYTTPGFMYDPATVNPWKPYLDYKLGDIVSYKNNKYVAIENISGSQDFEFQYWKQQTKDLPSGLMANWDYRVEQFRDFYNLDASIFDNNQKKLARHLIGYQDRPYLDNIIIDDVAQFKFYQGYIKEKGTFNSITKLFDVLRSSGFSTANLYEDWAFKVGDFGASESYSEIEFVLDESQFRYNPQDVLLTINPEYQNDLSIYNVTSSMVTIKPSDYAAKPFPIKALDTSQRDYGIFKYSVAGYVRPDDVEHIIYNRAALLNYDITQLSNGDKIWLAYTENNDWDVLEYIKLDLTINTWTVDFVTNSHIYLYCDTTLDLARGDLISISNLDYVNGSYIIQAVANNIITIYTSSTLATIPDIVTTGVIHRLASVRYQNLSSVSAKLYNKFDIVGEKLWIDSDQSGNWLVLENENAFYSTSSSDKNDEIVPYTKAASQQFGYDIKISGNGLFMVTSAPFNDRGVVIIYTRPNKLSSWAYYQILKIPYDFVTPITNDHFGISLEISYDGLIIAVGVTNATNARSFYRGVFNEYTSYNINDVVKYSDGTNYFFYQAKRHIPGNGSSFIYNNWNLYNKHYGDPGGYSSNLSNQGMVVIFSYDSVRYNKFLESEVLLSFDPTENEQFGSKLKMAVDTATNDLILFVSAKDYSYDRVTKTVYSNSSNSTTIHLTNTEGLVAGQQVFGIKDALTNADVSTKIVTVVDSTHIIVDQYVTVSSNLSLTFLLNSIGRVQVYRYNTVEGWFFNYVQPVLRQPITDTLFGKFTNSAFVISSGSQYGYDLDCLTDFTTVAISAPFLGSGVVYLYNITPDAYVSTNSTLNGLKFSYFGLSEIINLDTLTDGTVANNVGGYLSIGDYFGYKLVVSGNSLVVSAPNNSSKGNHVGAIFNFQKTDSSSGVSYQLDQVIIPPVTNTYAYERFGTSLSIDPNGNILSIGARGGPSVLDTTFDTYSSSLYSSFSFQLLDIVDITGTGPYYVMFDITPQLSAPPINVKYNISGNSNPLIDGDFLADSSTPTTVTFIFEIIPGEFGSGHTVASDPDLQYLLDPTSTELIPTTFDNNSTRFYDQIAVTGAVYVYNRFDNHFIYSDRLTPTNDLAAQDNFGFSIVTSSNCIAVGTPNKAFNGVHNGSIFVFNFNNPSWKTLRSGEPLVDISKFKKSFYYNTETNKIISNLDIYDPAKGHIPGIADQEIKYQTYYDPAVYQYVGDTSLAHTADQIWTDTHVGELWWDLSSVKYMWYEQGDVTFRNTHWGKLFPGSIVNVYEWVESKYLPSQYATLADTTAGLANGISGIPKDTSDLTYSTKTKYDQTSSIVTTLYYFWVSNRKIVPSFSTRRLSASDVTKLISDPKGQGYQSVSVTGQSSISLTNVKSKLLGKKVSINLQFYEVENTALMLHREYVLIPKGDSTAQIPKLLEQRWFDSLIGLDIAGNVIPDPKLSPKHRYGNSITPRQSWFVNKFEALKQNIEYINSILQDFNLLNEINLTNLYKQEEPPTLTSGIIDYAIDTLQDLPYVGTSNLITAQISLVIKDGSIYDAYVDDTGYGYGRNKVYQTDAYGNPVLWYGPTVEIRGTGTGGQLQTYVDSKGQVDPNTITVVKRGKGYNSIINKTTGTDISTTVKVRDFTVLVKSDSEALNGWSLQTWSFANSAAAAAYTASVQTSLGYVRQNLTKTWIRTRTQAYNTTRYWSFVDWYASGFGSQSDIKYIIAQTSDLNGLQANIGDLIKVTKVGLDSWILLLRIATTNDPDFTVDYKVVGQQNATIQFSSSLYNYNSELGYDENYSYDLNLYDTNPTTELRIILESIRDDILIGDLRIEYLNLFFNSIHYVLSEQHFVDWFFKSSFLKFNQIVGNLNQNPTFQADPLGDYESYIQEVKPYRTKIREFVSSYQGYDYSYNTVTDFDLPSYYNVDTGRLEATYLESTYINQYPWANWLKNHTYELTNIVINDIGAGYISRPVVSISAPIAGSVAWVKSTAYDQGTYISFNGNYYLATISGTTGKTPPTHNEGAILNGNIELLYVAANAKATAYISSGTIFKIVLDSPGHGFLSSPTITISGGNGSTGFRQATATAVIGNGKTRSMTLTMKFDRYLRNYYVDNFKFTDTYNAINQSVFKLTYAPEIEKNKFFITVNNIEYYGSQYFVSLSQELHDTYNALTGTVTFATPVSGTVIITYYKNIGLYSAADRINYAYLPGSSQYGKDLSQLMTGIDYGGVEFTSIGFAIGGGWDVLPWDVGSWDTIITSNDDYVVVLSNDILYNPLIVPNQFTLPYTPANGDMINIYLKPVDSLQTIRIDNPDYFYINSLQFYGYPTFTLNGVVNNTSSINFNSLEYLVKLLQIPSYDSATDQTTLIISVFVTQQDSTIRANAYPQPLAGWTIGSLEIINDATRNDYGSWSLILTGNHTLDFTQNSDYVLLPLAQDYIEISRPAGTDIGSPYFFDFGTDDFTIEMFVKPSSLPDTDNTPILTIGNDAPGRSIRILQNVSGSGAGILIPANDGTSDDYVGFMDLEINQWSHLALTRKDSKIYFHINGVLQMDIDPSTFDFIVDGTLRIGHGTNAAAGYFRGSISNLRILKGKGLYTLNFSVPTKPLNEITDYTALVLCNSEIACLPIESDGVNNTISLNIPGILRSGDQLIFRKSTSDGSILPSEQSIIDSLVSGGDLAYTSAKGITPEEILIDGDEFVSEYTNQGPEELIEGHVVDTVDIRFYDAPPAGGPKISISNFVGDGFTYTFPLGILPPDENAVIVFVDKMYQNSLNVNFENLTTDLVTDDNLPQPPALNSKITIYVIDTAGYDILSREIFTGDGVTNEFTTGARFTAGDVSVYALVDGVEPDLTIATTNTNYPNRGNVIVKLKETPPIGSVVQLMVLKGTVQKYSKVVNQTIPITGSNTYAINVPPGDAQPYSAYIWAIVNYTVNGQKKQDFLRAPDYENFIYPATMALDPIRYNTASLNLNMINVYLNKQKLLKIRDYNLDSINNIIKLTAGIAKTGDSIIIEIIRDNDFVIDGSNLVITKNYNLSNKDYILLTTFYNHHQWEILRTNKEFVFANGYETLSYDVVQYDTYNTNANTSGIFDLPRTVSDKSGVVVALSRELLVLGIDYVVLDNLKQIKVILPDLLTKSDYIEIITTNPNVSQFSFGFRIFKDMLNRTQYKRLDSKKVTKLASDLSYLDSVIEVENATNLDIPNRQDNLPGVIYIASERIEYMIKTGNVLSQLRRGTLGTTVNEMISAGTELMSMSYQDTLPYQDKEFKNTYIADSAIAENFGYNFGTYNGTIYGSTLIAPDHEIRAVISINQIDIPVILTTNTNTNKTNIQNAVNSYTNITGVLATRVVDDNHPSIANNPNAYDLTPVDISISVTGLVNNVTAGQYHYVTYNLLHLVNAIDTLALPVSQSFTIKGSVNTNYNGTYVLVDSTTTTATFRYPTDPGEFINSINILSFVSKIGNGPYFITFNIPMRTKPLTTGIRYNITDNINQNYNGYYELRYSTVSTVTFIYDTDPGEFINDVPVITRFSKTGTGPYYITYSIAAQETPLATGVYYNVSGSLDAIDYSILKNTSFYNGVYLATESTLTSITLEYPSDPGLFVGGIIKLSSPTKLNSSTVVFKEAPSEIKLSNVYILPLNFVPSYRNGIAQLGTGWYRNTIPPFYQQNDEMEIFISGTRLNKTPITVYDQSLAQDSYNGAGDKIIEAEYSVDGISSEVRLTQAPAPGSVITIITRKGSNWFLSGEKVPFAFSESKVAKFITATAVDLPK